MHRTANDHIHGDHASLGSYVQLAISEDGEDRRPQRIRSATVLPSGLPTSIYFCGMGSAVRLREQPGSIPLRTSQRAA